MVLTNSTKQMRTTKGTFNVVLSRLQIDGNSCTDLEGSQNHARIQRGVRIMRGSRVGSEGGGVRKPPVYIVKLLNICIGPPFPRPWKTFLDLCMEAISFCKKVSHLRMLIHIYFRGFFPGCTGKIRKVGIYMYTFNSFEIKDYLFVCE